MTTSRRDFLKVAAMLSGAAGVSGFVPDSVRRAFAIEPAVGSTYMDAEHVVILMQENRSFDHALGTLQGVRGFNDPRAIRLANGNSVFVQTDAAGNSYAPWRLDIKDTKITWMGSVPHTRHSQVDAWNDGLHDKWIDSKRSYNKDYKQVPLTMGHYTRDDLPFYYALADAFTICDQSYCSAMTSTTPNRCFFYTGTVRDEQHTQSRVFMRNDEIMIGGQTWKTFPERLQEAGVNWKYYQNDLTRTSGLTSEENSWLSNFGTNILESFDAYNVMAYPYAPAGMQAEVERLGRDIAKTQTALAKESDPAVVTKLKLRIANDERDRETLKKQLAKGQGKELYAKMTPAERALHDAAFVTNLNDPNYRSLEPLTFEGGTMNVPKGDVLHQFREDVNSGKLPTVSWLSSPEHFSDHPTSPWYGAWYVSEVMDILTKNPEVWKKTIFILTYDENDGYFDHAPSFVAADPKRPETGKASAGVDTGLEYTYAADEIRMGVLPEEARTGPIGMGYRVPTIVASPWSRGGWVNSQLFDHTSTLMFLEDFVQKKTGKTIRETNISPWRRAISGNLTSCFRAHDAKEATLSYLDRDKFVIGIRAAKDKEVPSNYVNLSAAQIADVTSNPQGSKFMSHQEPGVRPSCALPYELYAEGGLSADRTRFELHMTAGTEVHGGQSIGAPFNVYVRNVGGAGMAVATYTVKPGDTVSEAFPVTMFAGGRYELDAHGPNGFYRSFSGDAQGNSVQVKTVYEKKGSRLSGNVEVVVRNPGDKPVTIAVRDNAYKAETVNKTVAAGQEATVVLPLGKSHGWYDFTVRSEGVAVRSAGRVETGASSFSDPFMGMAV